jgi:hypothetical protein
MGIKMAKNTKPTLNENQMDLFSVGEPAEVSSSVVAPVVAEAVAPIVAEAVAPIVAEAVAPIVAEVVAPIVEDSAKNNSIKDFLQAKDVNVETEVSVSLEISGQLRFSRDGFINSIPVESRFVSLSLANDNVVVVTPYQEDGSLTLKLMKENFPGFVTQLQKVNDNTFIDSIDNMDLLDKLENIIEGKKIASMKSGIDTKQIDAEITFIGKLESGEVEVLDDEVPTVETKIDAKKVKIKI